MTRIASRIVLVLPLLFVIAETCQAQVITYLSQNRRIIYERDFFDFTAPITTEFEEEVTASGFGQFNAGIDRRPVIIDFDPLDGTPIQVFSTSEPIEIASQSSSLTFNSITASGIGGSVDYSNIGANEIGRSIVEVVFNLSEPTDYSVEFDAISGFPEFQFSGPNLDIFTGGGDVSESGVLEAGDYTLIAGGSYFNSGEFTLDVQINAVPEPSSLALVFGLFAGSFVVRRRRDC